MSFPTGPDQPAKDEIVPPDNASKAGLQEPVVTPTKEQRAGDLAQMIFIGAGGLIVILVGLATAVVLSVGSEEAASLLAFFGAIVSALGTLLGGIVGYYYGKSGGRS